MMAALITPSVPTAAALSSHRSLRSDLIFPIRPSTVVQRGRLASLKVTAMAPAKFKGTHMREKHLTEMIQKKVVEAKEACEDDPISAECKVAWDEVEEVSQAKADLRLKMQNQDPLESFCGENPETDECRIYED